MSRSSARAQTDPLVALVAVSVVVAGLGLYTVALDDHLSESAAVRTSADAERAAHDAAERVADAARVHGGLAPGRLANATGVGPAGYRLNATVRTAGASWHAGPVPPRAAASAEHRVAVRVGPGRVRPATLSVVVWR